MERLINARNYIIVKNKQELSLAKSCDICSFIIWEDKNCIYLWKRNGYKWEKSKYVQFGKDNETDETITGRKAYQEFYHYCGRDEVEKMKSALSPIPIWDSNEQLHFANIDFAQQKIYKNIYEFDANSAFTYGALHLPEEFYLLKEYMQGLFDLKESSTNKITRSKFKNLQNYLIGYFARIKEFVRVRSDIIGNSNNNITTRMAEINKSKGIVYLSNTDSIITDDYGADVMQKYLGNKAGEFKLKQQATRLYYKSSNAYQIGDKVVYSGSPYFARKHTDFFEDKVAIQYGSLVKGFDFRIEASSDDYFKICKVRFDEITVVVCNSLGEEVDRIYYKIGD